MSKSKIVLTSLVTSLFVVILMSTFQPLYADLYTRVTNWSANDVLTAAELNGEFNAIQSVVNGNISNENIKAAAAIDGTKLNVTTNTTFLAEHTSAGVHTYDALDDYIYGYSLTFVDASNISIESGQMIVNSLLALDVADVSLSITTGLSNNSETEANDTWYYVYADPPTAAGSAVAQFRISATASDAPAVGGVARYSTTVNSGNSRYLGQFYNGDGSLEGGNAGDINKFSFVSDFYNPLGSSISKKLYWTGDGAATLYVPIGFNVEIMRVFWSAASRIENGILQDFAGTLATGTWAVDEMLVRSGTITGFTTDSDGFTIPLTGGLNASGFEGVLIAEGTVD